MKWAVQLYFPLIDILEKADYRLVLLKIEKGFPRLISSSYNNNNNTLFKEGNTFSI